MSVGSSHSAGGYQLNDQCSVVMREFSLLNLLGADGANKSPKHL